MAALEWKTLKKTVTVTKPEMGVKLNLVAHRIQLVTLILALSLNGIEQIIYIQNIDR